MTQVGYSTGVALSASGAHCEDEYLAIVSKIQSAASARQQEKAIRRFVRTYPTFTDWLAEPLEQRLGRLRGEGKSARTMTNIVSYRARQYLQFASLTGQLALPWDYLIMIELRGVADLAAAAGHPWWSDHVNGLVRQATERDWSLSSAQQGISFCVPRFALRHADPTYVLRLTADDFVRLRGEIKDVYATVSPECNTRWQQETRRLGRGALSAAFAAHAIHFQLGLVADGPKQSRPEAKRVNATVNPAIDAAITRWQQYDEDRGTPAKSRANHSLHLRYFKTFLAEELPDLADLAQLHRAHILDFLGWLGGRAQLDDPTKLLGDSTRASTLTTVASMLRDLHEHELAPAPSHALIHRGDYPKHPKRLPRFIPTTQLHAVMRAIEAIEDPYQRCSLLVARWSGARRDEINRLELDCLDTYADGTYRLRIPAGKTGKERMIPLHDAAAEATQEVQRLRALDRDAGTIDRVTKRRVRYLFMARGRHLSRSFLFDLPLQRACEEAGLLTVEGGKLVTAHRFRHTLGTNLVEAGARWRTIMSILGHETADMTMTYAHISDPEVKADYQKVVERGVAIAGPAAERIKSDDLSQRELDWLRSNFYKSEMELGGCTRMPEEGPCECDIFLTCTKFFTTAEHAPRLRRRWHREQQLIDDARTRGWAREVERHTAIQQRVENLLIDLGEPLEGPNGDCSPNM